MEESCLASLSGEKLQQDHNSFSVCWKYTTNTINVTAARMISPTEGPSLVFFYKHSHAFFLIILCFFSLNKMPSLVVFYSI